MIQIKKGKLELFLLFVIVLIAVSGCTKSECKTSSDCSQKQCTLSKCEGKKCVYVLQKNCCGNKLMESIENGKPGSQCTCPEDYGKCEGKGKISIGARTEDASYVHYYCNVDNKCVLGVEKKDIVPQNFLDSISAGFFKASSIIRYNKPFDVSRGSFELAVTLDDAGSDLVLPITLTKAKILFSSEYMKTEMLIAERELNATLNGVGDKAILSIPLTLNYKPQQLEEAGSARYSIDYVYTKRVASGRTANGTNVYSDKLVREAFTSPTKPVLLVRS